MLRAHTVVHGDVRGSSKEYGFSVPAREETANVLAVYEAPIDLLAGSTLDRMEQKDWRTVHRTALAGYSVLSLYQYLKIHPAIDTVCLCLDNDKAGRTAAETQAGCNTVGRTQTLGAAS